MEGVSDPPVVSALGAAQREQFHRDGEKALSLVGLTLEDQQLVHIDGLDSAKACWDSLRAIYVRNSVGAQIHLMQKLLGTSPARRGYAGSFGVYENNFTATSRERADFS